MHAHHFVSTWIDDFDGDAGMFSSREGKRFCTAELLKAIFVDDTFEGAGDFVPCAFVGKEGLGDAEGASVVVGINEPRRDFVRTRGTHCVVYGVVDVHTLHLDDVLSVGCLLEVLCVAFRTR